jgi:hypoxanthine phosphoribosyltransferase
LLSLFENFEWYDFLAVAIFAKVFQVLIIVTLMGGGIVTATLLAVVWQGWLYYEKFRTKTLDI